MLNRRLEWLKSDDNRRLIRHGLRGIEKESLRIDSQGNISQRRHPRTLGSALTHPSITTDYSEALLELVTPPSRSNWETVQQLCDIHSFVHVGLDDELLWPMSMPCVVNAAETIPIADYGTSNEGMLKTVYRRGLGHRYGRAMQAIAGIHFNYSPPEPFWGAYSAIKASEVPLSEFKSDELMGLVRNFRRNAWLVVYLFGASPAFCKSFRPDGHPLVEELDASTWYAPFATSLRMSDLGYQNKAQSRLSVTANSLREYAAGLTRAVTTVEPQFEAIGVVVDGEYRQLNANLLQIENEYYGSIRPKPRKGKIRATAALRKYGVEYVEVRNIDLNPTDPVGLKQSQLRVMEALLLYCLLSPSPPISTREQAEIDARDLLVARRGRQPGLELTIGERSVPVAAAGSEIFEGLDAIAELLDENDDSYRLSVAGYRDSLTEPDRTPSALVLQHLHERKRSFFDYSLDIARQHREYFAALPLEDEKRSYFEKLAKESLSETARLEAANRESFPAYLEKFAAEA